jgi:Homeodomain-like domain
MTNRERARANAYRLRSQGLSIVEVADRLGVPRGTVGAWLRGCGERCLIRACALCGERFVTDTALRRFCCRGHQAKHKRLYGRPTGVERLQRRAKELEDELARLRAEYGNGELPRAA